MATETPAPKPDIAQTPSQQTHATGADEGLLSGEFWYTDSFSNLWSCQLIDGRMYPTGRYGGKLEMK